MKPLTPVFLDEHPRPVYGTAALQRVHGAEGNQYVVVACCALGDLLDRVRLVAQGRGRVDGKDDGCHPPLAVALGDGIQGRGWLVSRTTEACPGSPDCSSGSPEEGSLGHAGDIEQGILGLGRVRTALWIPIALYSACRSRFLSGEVSAVNGQVDPVDEGPFAMPAMSRCPQVSRAYQTRPSLPSGS